MSSSSQYTANTNAVQDSKNKASNERQQQHPTPFHAACDALGKFWQQHIAPKLHSPIHIHPHIQAQHVHQIKSPPLTITSLTTDQSPAPPSTLPPPPPQFQPTSREELGRATWVLLHTLAAQLPDTPTRQQRRDVRTLIDVLTRIYPCGDCATHWKHIVKEAPPTVDSRRDFEQWLCRAHNAVNRSLNKPVYNCNAVGLRWNALDCDEDQEIGCALAGRGGDMKRR